MPSRARPPHAVPSGRRRAVEDVEKSEMVFTQRWSACRASRRLCAIRYGHHRR